LRQDVPDNVFVLSHSYRGRGSPDARPEVAVPVPVLSCGA
jgi:hypothetical protein